MSVADHPVADHLATHTGDSTRALATVMGLPLLDGLFPALILADGITSLWSAIQVGLLIFGGSAMVTIVLAEFTGPPRDQAKRILMVGSGLIPLAVLEAALAPTIATLINTSLFQRFAALVILAIAAKTASAKIGDFLPRPGVIIGLGLVASITPSNIEVVLLTDPVLVGYAVCAACIGVSFALATALFREQLLAFIDLQRFRFGSAVALGVLAFSLIGWAPKNAPLLILLVSTALAIAPENASPTNQAQTPQQSVD